MIKIITLTLLLLSTNVYSFSFRFNFFGNNVIKNSGSYRSWNNGTFAKNCNEYRNPVANGYTYNGDIGNGIYRIKPSGSSVAFDIQCDMVTDSGGWSIIFDPANTINNCGSLLSANYGTCSATGMQQTVSFADGGNNLTSLRYSFRSQLAQLEFTKVKVENTGYCGFGDQLWGAAIILNSTMGNSTYMYPSTDSNYGFYTTSPNTFIFGWGYGHLSYGAKESTFSKTFSSFVNPIVGLSSVQLQDGRNNGMGCNNKKINVLKVK